MVALDGELDQPESGAVATTGERGCELTESAPASEVPHVREHAPGDVHRVMSGERWSSRMRDASALTSGRAAGTATTSAPRPQIQIELFLSSHLESA